MVGSDSRIGVLSLSDAYRSKLVSCRGRTRRERDDQLRKTVDENANDGQDGSTGSEERCVARSKDQLQGTNWTSGCFVEELRQVSEHNMLGSLIIIINVLQGRATLLTDVQNGSTRSCPITSARTSIQEAFARVVMKEITALGEMINFH